MADLNQNVGVRLTRRQRLAIDWLVYDRSEPGNQVLLSDVMREAVEEYVDRHISDDVDLEEFERADDAEAATAD